MAQFKQELQSEDSLESRSEVDRYLAEKCEDEGDNFDLLNWWKVNSVRYRIFSKVARDVLAIPVSTVASESTFSTAGRVLDPFRRELVGELAYSAEGSNEMATESVNRDLNLDGEIDREEFANSQGLIKQLPNYYFCSIIEDAHEDREKSGIIFNESEYTRKLQQKISLIHINLDKGKLIDGREIAVKRLAIRSSGQGLEELKTEVVLVAKLLHRNLIRLLGFCLEDGEKLLVYEYLPNGSLHEVLFDQTKRFSLEWERRYKIIVGIARGLLYLHEDSQLRIIHWHLKPSNILLDENMNPKISDFGLARLFGVSQTQGNTNRIAGTFGYIAPEYAKKGNFSTKSDVYSFGVLVLEIVAGQKNSSFRNGMNLQSYWTRHEVLKCIHSGLLCVQEAPVDRPKMSEIATMLSGYTASSFPAPSQPAFFQLVWKIQNHLNYTLKLINQNHQRNL
ncbi:cysteine-rich receptor-like protein kinase 10 [Carya illinoinensis]|uniref:cysteine-rich receptor-like protein kinase 10 n=1 Tax=Carya illinoinensis TaxID=32201 RepID=UPI001C723D0B|nr:cysteine-rich receptor-like protein kinase 10 [Carya illinoinensis]